MIRPFKLENFDIARIHFFNYLKKQGYNTIQVHTRNNERYLYIETDKDNFFLMFKREPFYSFGKIFLNRDETGETINVEDLRYCFIKGVKYIYIIYDNGNIYYQTPLFWASQQLKRITDNENKETYSISIKDLIRFNYDQEKKVICQN